ncbi:NADH-quinone oxidoreductase subunit NuoN [Nitrosomonas eutropha]|uniref:NADH-quinone oxidoreductase subunit N n=2 Tax=Nitrosomonas eutropha TaxID=916 RepID=A0ABX5M8S3_9PROT|nr:NADH-quinone oxidoreductase subunit NuoN [Nitrosomonas eutropha]ABI59195.1 NADH dehydrogenase subunit N [Nitrosomonas eutropha C91]PXV83441.1 NADH dehydrogenase subunit N [Nitrosomonas eutropha]SEI62734.1 NADH dehydrogenase subunit N [Nitrosomonas eutropha]
MDFLLPDFTPAYPEIFLLFMICVIMLADLFVGEKNRLLSFYLSLLTLAGCSFITYDIYSTEVRYTFSGMFVGDAMSDTLKLMIYPTVAAVLIYSRAYISLRGLLKGEFFSLTLFATLGMMVMVSASHLITLYLGIELLSLSLYAMVALQRESAVATEAAIKFFVLGALASGFLLYGMSMLYGATGTLHISELTKSIQQGTADHDIFIIGLVFVVAGISFKLSAVPFHMWAPDVYEGAPTAVTLFIGSAPKLAAFGFVMRLLVEGLGELATDWQGMLVLLSVASMAVGNFVAIAQLNIKRMLAYSTISHIGFVLLGFIAIGENGYSSAMFYVIAYVLMTLGAFGIIMLLSREGFEADKISDFKGLNQRSPWLAFMMLLIMFSMAGVPPMIGFYAKLAVFQAVLEAGYVWLVVVAVILALIGAFYYLRIVKFIYFDAPEDTRPILFKPDVRILISTNGLAIVLLGMFPQALMGLSLSAIQNSM